MATIEKLSISGIRSFGEDEEGRQLVPFDKPVTLILGENGCGKSTIIECLRFVTTQTTPYGKGTFVRDPDLTGSSTIKACIKLKLKNIRGEEVHLMRGLQGTRHTKTVSQKNLDSSITIKKPGSDKPITISSRCNDTAGEALRVLGISKAILDNVIFCTQEDSFWPLDSDKALKEKFDQIFDSEKYNKCLNKVKDVEKKLKAEKGAMEQDVIHMKEKKEAAHKKRREIGKINRSIGELEVERDQLASSLEPIHEQLQEIRKQEMEISSVYSAVGAAKVKLEGLKREEDEFRSRLDGQEFVGTNEELDTALSECNAQGRNTNELKAELNVLKNEEQSISSEIGQSLSRVGQLSKMVEINKAKIAEKERKISQISAQCGCADATEAGILEYVKNKKKELLNAQQNQESLEDSYQTKINKARDDVVNKEGDVRRLEESLRENKREMTEIKRDLDSAGESQLRRERICDELLTAEKELADHEQKGDVSVLTNELKAIQSQLKTAEAELANAEKEVKRLQSHAEHGRQLEYHRGELAKKEDEARRLRNSHRECLIEVLGSMPDNNFKQSVEQRGEQLASSAKTMRDQKANKDGAVIALRSGVTAINAQLQKKNAELQSFLNQVYEVTNGADLNATIDLTKKKVDDLQKEKGDLDASKHMFGAYIRALQREKPCCPLCSRDFAAEEEARNLAESLSLKSREVPTRLAEKEAKLKEQQQYLRQLYDLQSHQQKMDALKLEEIPALNQEQAEKKAAVTQTLKDLEDIEKKLQRTDKDLAACTNMIGDMALIDQSLKVIARLKADIQKIEPLLPPGWNKDLLKKAEEKRDRLTNERKQADSIREFTQGKVSEYNEKLLKLQSKKHKLAEEELALRSKDGKTKQQEDRLITLKNIEGSLLSELDTNRAQIAPLKDLHGKLVSELRNLKEKHKNIQKLEQNKLDDINTQAKDVERLGREISDFSRRGEEVKLSALRADISDRESSLQLTKNKIENVNAKLGDLAKVELRRHTLEDNKLLRQRRREREAVVKEHEELQAKFNKLGHSKLEREKNRLRGEEEKIGQRKANISGQIGIFQGQKTSIEKELDSAMYINIDARFLESLCRLRISDAQAQDLHRYCVAMDYAMGVYHQRAMDRVNGFIREYWSKIYRGNDIDFIEIQTEQAEVTEKRRSFNYKLVQVKGFARMDMRNRCSAGQKMLACLIVRMALAETFSSNCGILTLDEPTTNLDRKNINMLAETLNEVIIAKSGMTHTNFQLVIITHDKEFLKGLIHANSIERYIEVSRTQNGTSLITVRNVV